MVASSAFADRVALGVAQCIEFSGEDARAFVQAQFSADARTLQPLRWQWIAWLDHKGGVRALMHLADVGNGTLHALLRGGDAESLCVELRRYVLRAKVRIEPVRDRFLSIGPPLPVGEAGTEHGAIVYGHGHCSVIVDAVRRATDAAREREFRLTEIREGWPELPRGLEGRFLPPALGLEHLGAVSFDKGCYPGQEIAARLHYRGGHKRRLVHVLGTSALAVGEPLRDGSRDIILQAVASPEGCHALAVMDIELDKSISCDSNIQLIRVFEP